MKKTKTQKGITLIALIITIVVLLILAVVAINAVQGDGIISHAKNAKTTYQAKRDEESITLAGYEYYLAIENRKMSKELNPSGIIPDDAEFYKANETNQTTGSFPSEFQIGDTYKYGDYEYHYNQSNISDSFTDDTSLNGFGVKLLNPDRAKSSYGEILESINGIPVKGVQYLFDTCYSLVTAPIIPSSVTDMSFTFFQCNSLATAPIIPSSVTDMSFTFFQCNSLATAPIIPSNVTNMEGTFYECSSLVTAPIIPSNVTDMSQTFAFCYSLVTAPTIPSSVTNMEDTFTDCSSLVTASIIPSSVTDMSGTFAYCRSLTGEIEINTNLIGEDISNYGTFSGTTKEIKITGTTTRKAELAETSYNGNINY